MYQGASSGGQTPQASIGTFLNVWIRFSTWRPSSHVQTQARNTSEALWLWLGPSQKKVMGCRWNQQSRCRNGTSSTHAIHISFWQHQNLHKLVCLVRPLRGVLGGSLSEPYITCIFCAHTYHMHVLDDQQSTFSAQWGQIPTTECPIPCQWVPREQLRCWTSALRRRSVVHQVNEWSNRASPDARQGKYLISEVDSQDAK